MNKSQIMRFSIIFISITIALLFIFSHLSNEERGVPKVSQGVLDLADWSFEKDGPINLYGQWDFYWKEHLNPNSEKDNSQKDHSLISVPSQWSAHENIENKGFATYKLIIKNIPKYNHYGLKIHKIPSSYTLFINGERMGSIGEVGKNRMDETPAYGPKYLSFHLDNLETVEIMIHTSNFHYRSGGIRGIIQLGPSDQILSMKEENLTFQLTMIGGLLLLGLYHLSIFLYRRKELTSLFFGFICLSMALRALLVGETYFVNIISNTSYVLINKLIYLSIYAAVPLFIWFLYYLIKGQISLVITHILSTISLVFCFLVLITPIDIFTKSIKYFYMLILIMIVYYLFQIVKAVAKGKPGFVFLSLSAVFLAYAAVTDIILYQKDLQGEELTSLGIFVFVIGLAFVISGRLAQSFTEIENAQIQLQHGKDQLEIEVEERTKELMNANQKLEKLSFLDGLTNIPNRRFFDNTLEKVWMEAVNSKKPISLLMIDIDNFKQINDRYGHLYGDECLKKVAKLLETEAESIEQFATRYGGEEFSIILHNVNSIEAEQFANKCLKVVQNENISIDNNFNLTVSIGVATLIPGDEDKKKLISMADESLYKAKHNGKNQVEVYGDNKPHN